MLPEPRLHMPKAFWQGLVAGLHERTEGRHESGAFLLGRGSDADREAAGIVYYDDLDPSAYDQGICILHGDAFGRLWDRCSSTGLAVIADVHVHPFGAGQSKSDRENPMIARAGHLALILPLMAAPPVRLTAIGFYEYLGDHEWRSHGGDDVGRVLKIGGE
ncbi:MAG TPA: hypothetical protein VKP60_00415 [Magnetospirillaceae bacterium]|nr:hypothetical protein [Magnetospirillaceae bacterium]